MKIEDSFTVAMPIAEVWTAIIDPNVVGPCIPGCKAIEVLGPDKYRAEVVVALGPIKTTFNVVVEVSEMLAPERVVSVTRGEEGTRASLLTANNLLLLRALDDQTTEVAYSSEVSLVGRLGKFGLGIMKKRAKETGDAFAQAFRARLEQAQQSAG
ncbi:MAG TPA: SRPBCC domain-containing protein [Alphaproteobacteria bacterium]|nr:SRPBCC domain-containing protein [Alphaproteobacteria bacterium]